ncbi:Vitamin B12 transporter BtuB precursor [Roseovarius sp. THAF8]|uniref:TonB-dependent receptor plug domain-containing protein n=1 Tax=Roseovarius sp. THAF8 TaxID=2587846 RepID=UPI0012691915|nr:TonB-dependent receptor [Roseovarius sp. THAF8]QFT98598.1 Vitamin B12 transporter BtuB precursor [Roseovarius sp. THAF8]
MSRSFKAALAASTALFTQPAIAQDTPYDLGTIFVSGGLTPIEGSAYGRAGTVLTEEDIEDRGSRYAVDIIRSLPGVSVSRTGPAGGLTQVRMRGHEGNHTLVIIDGVEVASPSQGEYDFSGLLSADIERIEVLRGPQSSLYGSNAIGGVISITTKRATEPGFSGQAGFEIGTDETTQVSLALRQRTEKLALSFSATRRETGGYDVSGLNGEDDGDLNETYNLNVHYYATENLTFGGTLRHVKSDSDSDGQIYTALTPAGQILVDDFSGSDTAETFGSIYAQLDTFGGRFRNRLDLSFADIQTDRFNGTGAQSGDTTETRQKISYKGSVALDGGAVDTARHILTLGAEWERETFVNNNPAFVFAPSQLIKQTREQTALVAEYQGNLTDSLDVQASVRHDFNDEFEDFTTYAVGVSYMLPSQTTRLHASYGTGVQNPTMFEQFGFSNNFIGNPNLEPEQSEGWDFGVEQQFLGGRGLIDVTYFDDELTNEISSTVDPGTGSLTPFNQAGKSDRRGVEIGATWQVNARLDLGLNYTWLDAENPNGSTEVRRPEHEVLLQLGYDFPDDRTRFTMDVQHVANNVDLFFPPSFISVPVTLPDYTLVNVGLRHQLTDSVEIYGRIENLTDEKYQEVLGYETPGRTAFFGLTATF